MLFNSRRLKLIHWLRHTARVGFTVLVIEAFVHRVWPHVHLAHFLRQIEVSEPQKLHQHIPQKLRVVVVGMHLHVVRAVLLVRALISYELTQRVAVYCRVVNTPDNLAVEALFLLAAEANQLVHDKVGGLHVLQSVCEEIHVCEDPETLVDVFKIVALCRTFLFDFRNFSRWKREGIGTLAGWISLIFLRAIVHGRIGINAESFHAEIDAVEVP